MAASRDHYDAIVIGSGPGGASLAHRLATTGKQILMLERGSYLPRSRDNWDSKKVFGDAIFGSSDYAVAIAAIRDAWGPSAKKTRS